MPHRKKHDEESIEPTGAEEMEPNMMEADIAALQEELQKLKADVEKAQDSYLRTLADFDNFRKRQRDECARLTSFAREELILKVFPIMDNFQRALQAAEAQHSYESLVEGVSLTLRQMQEMLKAEGVEAIEAAGQEFNPELHEALMTVATDEYPPHTVIDELEQGYMLNGKLLRPARVRVAVEE